MIKHAESSRNLAIISYCFFYFILVLACGLVFPHRAHFRSPAATKLPPTLISLMQALTNRLSSDSECGHFPGMSKKKSSK